MGELKPGQLPGPKRDAVSSRQEKEAILDTYLELLLQEYAEKINEGNNGVVFLVDFGKMPEEFVKSLRILLKEFGVELGGEKVVKVLKLYRPGAGKKEFDLQKKAFDIVEKSGEDAAKVPTPILFRDLSLTDATRTILKQAGVEEMPNRAELLIMDFVPGVDLLTYLYREVAKVHPALEGVRAGLAEWDYVTLEKTVGAVLGFGDLSIGKDGNAETRARFEARKRMYVYLQSTGYVFPAGVLAQFEKTITLFHKSGLCWRDGHQRNFMIVEELDKDPQGFIIDFGRATTFVGETPDAEDYWDRDLKISHIEDRTTTNELRRLTRTDSEKVSLLKKGQERSLNSLESQLSRNKAFYATWEAFVKSVESGEAVDLDQVFDKVMGMLTPGGEEVKVALIVMLFKKLVDKQKIASAEARGVIKAKAKAVQSPIGKKKLEEFATFFG